MSIWHWYDVVIVAFAWLLGLGCLVFYYWMKHDD